MDINKVIVPERKLRGRQLRIMRVNSGLTQIGLANISTISQKTISKIERGLVSWSIDTELIFTYAINNFLQSA